VAGIQNGGPDGIALVNAGGAVVQFLSYEGSFSASDGPATGQASTPITQSETSNTASGTSLQLAGSGSHYGDFSWQPSAAHSFGACNPAQTPTGGSGDDGGNGDDDSVLSNGVPILGLAAGTGQALQFTIEVPAGATNLHIASSGGNGDADLYVRHGQAPTTSSWDCRPYLYGHDEQCDFAPPAAGPR